MTEFASVYEFPQADGAGQQIGVIELGGGYRNSDIVEILALQNLPTDQFSTTDVSIDGASNNPGSDASADRENALDIQIIISACPKVNVRVYFAPNSDQSFYNAVERACIVDKMKIFVICWGKAESQWNPDMIQRFNDLFQAAANLGCTVFCASGDKGSSDGDAPGNHVDFPASSQYVTGVGGTSLQTSNGVRTSEVVWNNNSSTSATGGGLSNVFDSVAYQTDNSSFAFNGKRGVPDDSGPSDPFVCGTNIFIADQGGLIVVGGTSASCPINGALACRVNQLIAPRSIGFFNPAVYPFPDTLFYDITVGENGAWQAAKFWDPCTGNGSPVGTRILALYQNPNAPIAKFSFSPASGSSPLKVDFVDATANVPTSWLWDFGTTPSSTSIEQNPTFTFTTNTSSIIFTVTLTVKNDSGTSSVVHTVTVEKGDPFPLWAIILIVVIAVLILILGIYFGWKAKRAKSHGV
jgi:kumamolisin